MFTLSALYNIAPFNSRTRGCACNEVAALRSTLRRGAPFDEQPVPPHWSGWWSTAQRRASLPSFRRSRLTAKP